MGLIGREILKKGEAMEKSIHEQQKAELVYLCVREKKVNFEITLIILKYIRNVNLSYSKMILKLQNFYQNILFFNFGDCPKNGEGNKQRTRRKYMHKSN